MNDNENLLSIPQKILKKISNRNLSDTNSDSGDSLSNMDTSPEITSPQSKEQAFQNDSRFRKYVQLVEKNLQSFDAVNEWADIISFLGRLLKSFQAYPQFPVIPRKQLVAKRLAQCLNPGFPAGVHQKTLEVYAFILKTIGSDQFAQDLALWSTGLFPFVQYAATHVKPQLVSIFETYYLPLRGRLRPAMRGFIIALLPALEEEGSEYFDKIVALIENLSETVELPFFYSCMWLVMISNPSLRTPALNYLLQKLPKITDKEAVALVLGGKENVSLMVRAFASTLNDQQLLVQRGMLELLVQNFTLKSRMIPHDDLVILMRAALGIVLRKDMSLNRRLYAWLLGAEGTTQAQMLYFNTYAEKPAIQAVRGMIHQQLHQQKQQDNIATEEQHRPYKILISLMDKWELGQPIVSNVFVDSISSLKSMTAGRSDVIKTANMWINMVEPYLICMKLYGLIDISFPDPKTIANKKAVQQNTINLENISLVEFTLDSIQFADDEVKHIHLPLILAALTRKVKDALKSPDFIENVSFVSQGINLILQILERLPESVFLNRATPPIDHTNEDNHKSGVDRRQFQSGMNIVEYAREFYSIGQSLQQTQQPTSYDRQEEYELKGEETEESGDLSSSANLKKNQTVQYVQYQSRPEFDPLRGQLLVKEIADNLSSFLVDFANSYIILPKNLQSGVDVGVEGKRLSHLEHYLERIFLGVSTAIAIAAKYVDDQFVLTRQEPLTYVLLKCSQQVKVFGIVDAALSTLTVLVRQKRFVDPLVLTRISQVKEIVDRLWGFLVPSMQLLHMRIVELLWLLIDASLPHQIETIISNYLIHQDDSSEMLSHYEKFGIVWELSENIPEASVVFSRPMFIMLDLLREGASPMERRAGDLWIRCHLKSYVRLLEPFMLAMMDKQIMRRPAELKVDWKNQILKQKGAQSAEDKVTVISYFVYAKPFDADAIDYLFTTLITLITFGGLNVLKSCKHHIIDSESTIAKVAAQEPLAYPIDKHTTFLDLLVMISIRFLETEPNHTDSGRTTDKTIYSIELHAADVLYLIISKLDYVNMKFIRQIQTSILNKLLFCINTKNLDLQQKLLHLLHGCLAIICAASQHTKDSGSHSGHQKKTSIDSVSSTSTQSPNEAIALVQSTSDVFVKCIIDAFSLSSNRAMLQHWMDFVLAALPYIKFGFRPIVVPIIMCTCQQLGLRCDTIEIMIHEKPQSASCASAEKEMLVLLLGLEKMLMFCLTERSLNDDWFANVSYPLDLPMPRMSDSSALLGFAQVVHGTGSDTNLKSMLMERSRDTVMYHLPVVLEILLNAWHVFRKPQWDDQVVRSMGDSQADALLHSFSYAAEQVKRRLESIFEKLFKYSAADFVEGLTEIFYVGNPVALEFDEEAKFDEIALEILVSTPSNTPQHVISTLLDSIRQRTPGTNRNRRRRILRQGKLTDTCILRFADIYCRYIKNPESIVLLWPVIHSFSKDYLSQANTYKAFLPSLMRFLTVTLEEISKSVGYEQDKRIRKDAQDLYQRCIDYCILIAGKSLDQSSWVRGRSALYDEPVDDAASTYTTDSVDTYSGHTNLMNHSNSSSAAQASVDTLVSRNVSLSSVSEMEKKTSWKLREDVMINQVNQYLASQVIPRLRLLIGDNDKINSLLNNLVYYIIGPSLKSKSRNPVILEQLCEMARMPFTYKTWRKEVWEVFIDNRFFYMNNVTAKKWSSILQTAFSIEKERMTELLARITTTPSNTFFSSRDQETLSRSLNLRRLSFVLLAGTLDQYVPQLPIIQEKIVELLRLDHSEMVHGEIYLCLRIILMRFSQKHLLNFWPVLITELMRLFNSFVYQDFQDRPEEAQIALAGCKFLDLLCTLELDAFQIYQWIFIRDTIETLIKTHTEGPIPIMEALDDKMASSSTDAFDFSLFESDMQPSLGSLRRPMLTMHSIVSIRQLAFFIEQVGLYVYQSAFTLSKPDLPFIESLLLNDLLDEESATVEK